MDSTPFIKGKDLSGAKRPTPASLIAIYNAKQNANHIVDQSPCLSEPELWLDLQSLLAHSPDISVAATFHCVEDVHQALRDRRPDILLICLLYTSPSPRDS